MTGYAHFLIGTSVSIVTIAAVGHSISWQTAVIGLAVGCVAALLPDLDTEHSILKHAIYAHGRPKIVGRIKRRSSLIEIVFISILGGLEIIVRSVAYLIVMVPSLLLEHRAMTHYLITPLVIWVILAPLLALFHQPQFYGFIFFIGYLSHLLSDCLTYSGVQLFAPFSRRSIHLLPYKLRFTNSEGGSTGEKITLGIIGISSILLILWLTK